MAAHLHDSVLQTLALVQRRADDPREVVRLARMQERELRDWLLQGDDPPSGSDAQRDGNGDASFGAALEDAAALVEREYGVPIEVVRVRDCPIVGLEPLVLAAKEGHAERGPALRRAGRVRLPRGRRARTWSCSCAIAAAASIPTAVGEDRGGIAASVVGRLARNGGEAHDPHRARRRLRARAHAAAAARSTDDA